MLIKNALRGSSLVMLASVLQLGAVAAHAAGDDPWERVNRKVFGFNETVDAYGLKPLAQGYQYLTPHFLQDGVHNVFDNVGDVTNFANNLLQVKPEAAGKDLARIILNTTFGLLGFFDVGTKMGLQRSDEDFGQTLGYWGVAPGPYVVLPFFGPSDVRDGLSKLPDTYTYPYRYIDDVPVRNSTFAASVVDTRSSLLSVEKIISGDKYIFLRNAYLQNREYKTHDGQVKDDF